MFYRILFTLLMLQSLVLSAPAPVDQPGAQPPTGETMSAAFSAVATFAATAYSFAISWVLPAQHTPVAPAPTGYLASLKMIASQALTLARCHAACLSPRTLAHCPAGWVAPPQPSPPSFVASLTSIASQPFLIAHDLAAHIHATASSVSMWGALFVVACCFVTSWVCMARTQTYLNRQSADISAKIDSILNVMDTWEERITRIQASLRQTTDLSERTAGNACPGCETMTQTLVLVHSKSVEHDARITDLLNTTGDLTKRVEGLYTLYPQFIDLSNVVTKNIKMSLEVSVWLRNLVHGPTEDVLDIRKRLDEPSTSNTLRSAFQPISTVPHPNL